MIWAVVAMLAMGFAGAQLAGLDPRIATAALVALAVFLWATLVVPEYLTALLFFAAVLVTGIASEGAVLAGFSSKAIWLVFAGIILGEAIQQHDFGKSIFDRLLGRLRSYGTLIWLVAVAGLMLAFVIPSAMGRVVLTAPLAIGLCDQLGFGKDAPERSGVYLATILGTTLPAFSILTSNVPNLVLLGAMEAAFGVTVSYGDYFVLNFPVLGIGAFLMTPMLILVLFPGRIDARDKVAEPAPWTPGQKKLAALLCATLALWASDELHGISPAWIGLCAAILCMAPGGLVSPAIFKKLNFGPWFFVAGAIGLGAVVAESGLGEVMWSRLAALLPLADLPAPAQFAALVSSSILLGAFATLPAAPSVYTPLAESIAATIGWPLQSVILAEVPSFVFFAFPYQAPPVLVGLILLKVPLGRAAKLLGIHFVAGVIVVIPLHYLWGRALGVFP
jgi:hypothetical protein